MIEAILLITAIASSHLAFDEVRESEKYKMTYDHQRMICVMEEKSK